jgi:group I intron endonuclease
VFQRPPPKHGGLGRRFEYPLRYILEHSVLYVLLHILKFSNKGSRHCKLMGVIYKLTSPSGQSYVGQTIRLLRKRLLEHQRLTCCPALHNAIKKYGFANFNVETLWEGDNDLLNQKEIEFIAKFDTKNNGYNACTGGHLSDGRKGIPMTEEAKSKISESLKGRPKSDEMRQRLSEALKGKKRPPATWRHVAVQQLNKDGSLVKVWGCGSDAAKALGIHNSNINKCLKGHLGSSGGFKWAYHPEA